jgi:predicted amidohydrolase YtcJ
MVVLSKDPLAISPEDFMSIEAEVTVVDGRVVFERP